MQQNAPFCVLPTAFSLSRVGMYDIHIGNVLYSLQIFVNVDKFLNRHL